MKSAPVKTPVYLDHNATTPCDPRVLEVMNRVHREHFGNPASFGHAFGWSAAALVEKARGQVAGLIGAEPHEIVFTSGATEADNLAVLGVAAACAEPGHLVCSVFEHEAVLEPVAGLEARGWRVTRLPADGRGLVEPALVGNALQPDTRFVAVMAAQNEIGTIQPVAGIGRICREKGVPFFTDAVQAVAYGNIDVRRDAIDLLSLSGHKIHGPKGVGALFVRAGRPHLGLVARQLGGGQERGLRAGTLNVPGIVGLGEACVLAAECRQEETVRLGGLRDGLWKKLRAGLGDVVLNGAAEPRLPHNLNLSFPGVPAHALLGRLTRLAVSSSSACTSGSSEPSAVLLALGVEPDLARSSLRISLGRFTTGAEVDFAAEEIVAVVRELRRTNPPA
ncbi:IscS subfamily cysteine desulfurase [bacterium CG_4_9_14_3_um_filter_65_15]|nr:MAG: IscS subfamily cysteine desulfurase [bacterium CG_4_9_14_3_um_filter_65_15]